AGVARYLSAGFRRVSTDDAMKKVHLGVFGVRAGDEKMMGAVGRNSQHQLELLAARQETELVEADFDDALRVAGRKPRDGDPVLAGRARELRRVERGAGHHGAGALRLRRLW